MPDISVLEENATWTKDQLVLKINELIRAVNTVNDDLDTIETTGCAAPLLE
jgi:hypothetical protein